MSFSQSACSACARWHGVPVLKLWTLTRQSWRLEEIWKLRFHFIPTGRGVGEGRRKVPCQDRALYYAFSLESQRDVRLKTRATAQSKVAAIGWPQIAHSLLVPLTVRVQLPVPGLRLKSSLARKQFNPGTELAGKSASSSQVSFQSFKAASPFLNFTFCFLERSGFPCTRPRPESHHPGTYCTWCPIPVYQIRNVPCVKVKIVDTQAGSPTSGRQPSLK